MMKSKLLGCLVCVSLWMLCGSAAHAQRVTGVVTDDALEAVVGAVVRYSGLERPEAITDSQGRYSIEAKIGQTLVFSCFGLQDRSIKVTEAGTLDVRMAPDAEQIRDAVVIGYDTQSRRDLTGSVASVGADQIKQSASSSLLGSLEGRVAGLSIGSQSGEPGAGYQIRVRGSNSVNASNSPLIVVDGIQMDIDAESSTGSEFDSVTTDPLSFLNPNDIASIEVLKDASAVAIYGARGSNGVVLITTKGGTDTGGKTVVTLDATLSLASVQKRIEMLNAQEWVNYRFWRRDYGGFDDYGQDTDGDGINDAPMDVSGMTSHNWQREIMRTAATRTYNLGVRGSIGKGTQIYAGLGYMDQQGIIIGNSYKRYSARTKIDHKIGDKVKVGVMVNYSRVVGDGAMTSTGGGSGFTTDGIIQLAYRERPVSIVTESDESFYTEKGYTLLNNFITKETMRSTLFQRATGNAYAEWEIIPDLTFKAQLSGTVSGADLKEFYTSRSRWGHQNGGVLNLRYQNTASYVATTTLKYKHTWNKHHNFDALAGAEMSDYIFDSIKLSGYNFDDESSTFYNIAKAGVQKAPNQNYYTYSKMSAFGRINYNYRSRYYLTFNVRADASSRFSEGSRVGYFPSLSVGWRPSNEPFLKYRRWLDNLMIRGSVGTSGNDRITMYSNLAQMDVNYYAVGGQEVMGVSSITSGNSSLKWETTWQYDLGLDFEAFKRRLSISADVYYKDTRNMLYQSTLSAQSGFARLWDNIGRVTNRGVEISLGTKNIVGRNFSWSTNVTFDLNRNKLRDIGENLEYREVSIAGRMTSGNITRLIVGEPIGVMYGYVADGVYQFDDFVITRGGVEITDYSEITSLNYQDYSYTLKDGVVGIANKTVKPGDRKYKDLSGDNTITVDDRKVIGRPFPLFSAGMGNTFTWKGLELYVFMQGSYGNDIFNEFKAITEPGENLGVYRTNVTRKSYYGAWTPEHQSNTYARLLNQTNGWFSSYYVEDASYLRLKTVALSWMVPSNVCERLHLSSLKLTFTGDNLYTLTGYSGLDPAVTSDRALFPSWDRATYPKARTFTLGFTANF